MSVGIEIYADLCPGCGRHFTDLTRHVCSGEGPKTEVFGIHAPEFKWERWVEIFWSRVEKRGPDECWPWRAAVNPKSGYGALGVPAVFRQRVFGIPRMTGYANAHRVAWALANGAPPVGGEICHRCNNRPCCNPAHLYLGNHAENMNDLAVTNRRKNGGSK